MYIDGERLLLATSTQSGTGGSCADAFPAAQAHAAARGRIIVGIEVDGCPLSGDEVNTAVARAKGASRVNLTTETPEILVGSALLDAAEMLRNTDGPRDAAVKHIRAGRLGDALREIESLSKRWQEARQAVEQSAELLGVGVGELIGSGATPAGVGAGRAGGPGDTLALCLKEISRCVRESDWSGLADVLEFDLAEESERWFERLVDTGGRLTASSERGATRTATRAA